MSLSRIIKSSRRSGGSSILVSRPAGGGETSGGFHSLASMWQSDDPELMAGMSELEAAREKLRQETEIVKAETAAMVAAAQAQVAEIEKSAYDKGFAEGQEAAKAKEDARLAQIDALFAAIEQERQKLYAQYEADILTLVKAMVDRVLFHEVTVNPQAIEICLKTALAYVVENSNILIRLNGLDLERIKQAAMERPEMLTGYKKIDLAEDPAIGIGGCKLDTGFGEIDATLESRKEKVFAAIDAVLQKAIKTVG